MFRRMSANKPIQQLTLTMQQCYRSLYHSEGKKAMILLSYSVATMNKFFALRIQTLKRSLKQCPHEQPSLEAESFGTNIILHYL